MVVNSLACAATKSIRLAGKGGPFLEEVPNSIEGVRDDTYYLEMIVFDIEDVLFWIPKHQFLQHTDAFVLLLNGDVEDTVTEDTLKLSGITAADFDGLMRYMYPLEEQTSLSKENWVSTLRLSTRWRMLKIRAKAIDALQAILDCPAEKVQLGLEFFVVEWLEDGYVALARRNGPISTVDVARIGIQRAVKLSSIREQHYEAYWNEYLRLHCLDTNGLRDAVERLFTTSIISTTSDKERTLDSDLVERIIEANKLGDHEYIMCLYQKLFRRWESLTVEEAEKLGVEMALKVLEARIEARKAAQRILRSKTKGDKFRPWVADGFEHELAEIRREGQRYSVLQSIPETLKSVEKEHALISCGGLEKLDVKSSSSKHVPW